MGYEGSTQAERLQARQRVDFCWSFCGSKAGGKPYTHLPSVPPNWLGSGVKSFLNNMPLYENYLGISAKVGMSGTYLLPLIRILVLMLSLNNYKHRGYCYQFKLRVTMLDTDRSNSIIHWLISILYDHFSAGEESCP